MTVAGVACEAIHEFNPLEDPRWDRFVQQHPQSSVFHTTGWLEALRRTYAYRPQAITTSEPQSELENALVFCSISSWLTGHRWVSLPFSDHCQPLSDEATCKEPFLFALTQFLSRDRLRYFETRPLHAVEVDATPGFSSPFPALVRSTSSYCWHHLDLTPDLETLFRNCHKDSTQRKILRAKREQLRFDEGSSPTLLNDFFNLHFTTRRRHCLPPQPKVWFRNVAECLGNACKIRVAYRDTTPVAAILTITHKDTTVYKYGGSDTAYNHLGGMHGLIWGTIEEAKKEGRRTLDLGRSNLDNNGLITFKDRWGSRRSILQYTRFSDPASRKDVFFNDDPSGQYRLLRSLFARMPNAALRLVGERFYKHMG